VGLIARSDLMASCGGIVLETSIAALDWLGIVAFTITGALVASRNQMDVVGFVLLGTVTGIGGGTIRDLLLNVHPILWIEQPHYLAVCIGVSLVVYVFARRIHSHMRLIRWADAVGLALFSTLGAERAISAEVSPLVAIVMGVITACFGGIVRDLLGQMRSIIFSYEIYVTAAVAAAAVFVLLHEIGGSRELAVLGGVAAGFVLRAGALIWEWSLPHSAPWRDK
jgi:uncharacterized membrane protein YeiH